MLNELFDPSTASLDLLGCIEIAQAMESYENFNLLLDLDEEEAIATEAASEDPEMKAPSRKKSMLLAMSWVEKFRAWSLKRIGGEFEVNAGINMGPISSNCKDFVASVQTAKSKEEAEKLIDKLDAYLATQYEKAAKGSTKQWIKDDGKTRSFVDWLSSRCNKERLVKANSNYPEALNMTVQAATKVMAFLDTVVRSSKADKSAGKDQAKADLKAAKAAKKAIASK